MDNQAVNLSFQGGRKELFWLHFKAFFLMIITFGIYRFWFKTNLRRYLWNKITISNDERLEYTGTGGELFKGFLVALVFIVPLQIGFTLASLTTFHYTLVAFLSLIAIYLSYFAIFASRRYRLNRTLWRGLRFRLEGSGWAYALYGMGWALIVILTLGLAAPWATTWLERYKMQRTGYGDEQGAFAGEAITLFKKLLPFTLISILPLLFALYKILTGVEASDFADIFTALNSGDNEVLSETFDELEEKTKYAFYAAAGAIPVWFFLNFVFLPAKIAILFKWWADGVRFGEASLQSSFKIWNSYKIFLKAWLVMTAVSIIFSVIAFVVLPIFGIVSNSKTIPGFLSQGTLFYIVIFILYLILIFLFWVFKVLMISFPFWRDQVNSLSAHNLASLEGVVARAQESSAMGESLADGGADLGF